MEEGLRVTINKWKKNIYISEAKIDMLKTLVFFKLIREEGNGSREGFCK